MRQGRRTRRSWIRRHRFIQSSADSVMNVRMQSGNNCQLATAPSRSPLPHPPSKNAQPSPTHLDEVIDGLVTRSPCRRVHRFVQLGLGLRLFGLGELVEHVGDLVHPGQHGCALHRACPTVHRERTAQELPPLERDPGRVDQQRLTPQSPTSLQRQLRHRRSRATTPMAPPQYKPRLNRGKGGDAAAHRQTAHLSCSREQRPRERETPVP
jgi:hypothetical protein